MSSVWGEITDFGSIWVNGVEYDTRNADVYVDSIFVGSGDQAILQNLDVGRIVLVKGRRHDSRSGTADEIYYTSAGRGPIDAIETIDASTIRLTILGQTVIVDDRTHLKDVDADDLEVNNFVDVSGSLTVTVRYSRSFWRRPQMLSHLVPNSRSKGRSAI